MKLRTLAVGLLTCCGLLAQVAWVNEAASDATAEAEAETKASTPATPATIVAPSTPSQPGDLPDPGQTAFPVSPITRPDGGPWRIGYLQGGDHQDYTNDLLALARGLDTLDWIEFQQDVPAGLNGRQLWSWLANNTRSHTIRFVEDAWWQPGDFDESLREPTRQAILARVCQRHDVDLMLAMGTWAGQDMRAIGPPVPTEVISATDPVAAGISDSAQDSGRDNLHTDIEAGLYRLQLRLFHEIVPFKTLGIVYEDSPAGRSYAALATVQQAGQESGFAIEACITPASNMSAQQAMQNTLECYRKLADRGVDAVYVTSYRGSTRASTDKIVHILLQARIPSFSMGGPEDVRSGILLSLAQADPLQLGYFHAKAIAQIFHGAMPRRLNQIWNAPPKIALNLLTARKIGFDPPIDILLAADEVYETIRQ